MPHLYQNRQRHSAFSLVEIMAVLTIFGFVAIGLTAFMISSMQGMFWAANKSQITSDVRNFSLRLSKETLGARTAFIYSSFAAEDRSSIGKRRDSGQTGDCLVLIYYDPYPTVDDDLHYTKLVVFFRAPDEDGISPVYRAEKTFETPLEISDNFETVLATYFPDDSGDYPIVLELSRGLANGKLFRNFGNNTYVINGEILHGNQVKEVTNTYNLTISPRG
jgi:type II secretory pathway pseudopilin PulG